MILKILIIFAILDVVLFCAYFFSRRRLRVRLASQSQIIQTVAGLVEYVDAGKGSAIVHLHGMLGGFDH